MCIGIPMQVIETDGRLALCEGRGERRRINTALVGDVAVGDWLLVFLDDARERIDVDRATEVNAALDLVLAAMQGIDAHHDVDFAASIAESPEQMAPNRSLNRMDPMYESTIALAPGSSA